MGVRDHTGAAGGCCRPEPSRFPEPELCAAAAIHMADGEKDGALEEEAVCEGAATAEGEPNLIP